MATPFLIDIPEQKLQLLRNKLALVTFPDELDAAGWDYGVPLQELRELVQYWQNSFDWRAQEAHLNETLPQFTAYVPVDGFETLNVHFVHKESAVAEAIPLLFVHGWPGSFIEVIKVLPLLTTPTEEGAPAFHVVAVGLPGFGFSQGTKKKGFSIPQYAEVCHKVMLSLGYEKYVTQGGDWGFLITRTIGLMYGGSHCMGSHINMAIGTKPRFLANPLLWLHHALTPYSAAEKAGLARTKWFRESGSGYMALQSTKPQTLGYSLADSPVGLLAWIYEKLRDWTDSYPWTKDESKFLTWVSIYLFSREGPATSVRIYYESARFIAAIQAGPVPAVHTGKVPLGISFFPKEIMLFPRHYLRTLGNIRFESEHHERGGHFAAYEVPELLVNDVRSMFGKGGGAFGVVPKHSGYEEGKKKTDAKL